MTLENGEWSLLGHIFVNKVNGVDRVKIYIPYNVFEMQLCYLDPILKKFSLMINNEMNPDFDYLSRLEEIERVMKSDSNSETEMLLKTENEKLLEKITILEEELDVMRKAVNDVKIIKEPIIFDGV